MPTNSISVNSSALKSLKIAQFSDCHLFADIDQQHYGANVFTHLVAVLSDIAEQKDIDFAVFTGDLSQDHSAQSYQRFVEAVALSNITVPIYFIAGNHDDSDLLDQYLVAAPFTQAKSIVQNTWQILLLNSQTATPAGEISAEDLARLAQKQPEHPFTLVFMHHHPLDVGYFIDRHGLLNQQLFWAQLATNQQVRLIACGHVHRGMSINKQLSTHNVELLTCPATSIEFAQHASELQATSSPAGYRIIELYNDGQYASHCVYLSDK